MLALLELAQQKCEYAGKNSRERKKKGYQRDWKWKGPISGKRLNGLIMPFSCRQNSMQDYVSGFGGNKEQQPKKEM